MSDFSSPKFDYQRHTIYPIGVYRLTGLTVDGEFLLSVDRDRGYLVQIDPKTNNTTIVNPFHLNQFRDVNSLTLHEQTLWYTQQNVVYFCPRSEFTPQVFVEWNDPVDGIAVRDSTVYVACRKAGGILIFNRHTGALITKLRVPGVGIEYLTLQGENLWIADQQEQTVYCLDRGTGEIKLSVLTPFANPTGLTFYQAPATGETLLYLVYADDEAYIRDDPNFNPPQQLAWRDRTFIHPLHIYHNPERHCSLSNGYLIEMSYVEELLPLDEFNPIENLEWRIALPSNTDRQTVRSVEPIGMPFTEMVQDGERIAVFKFNSLTSQEGRIFGWKAVLEVRGIKYSLVPLDVEKIPPLPEDLATRYLVDDDELAMDTPIVKEAAKDAIARETNLLRQMLKIRNYVYDSLDYSLTSKIEAPDVVLRRGIGSCGEYVGVLLALSRLNQIACRTIGRYKCPATPDRQGIPLSPDYNHVWLEFYIPGFGWVPMESNPDDMGSEPHLTRFFMGLSWYHIEIGKGISFEKLYQNGERINKEVISIGDLALNHVRFTILEELPPLSTSFDF